MANKNEWKTAFGHNINKVFWPILSAGLFYSLIDGNEGIESCDVDRDLHPETLLLGLIDYVCRNTIEYLHDHKETLEEVGEELLKKSRLNLKELQSIVKPE